MTTWQVIYVALSLPGVFIFLFMLRDRYSRPKQFALGSPMKATVLTQCSTCRGHGREGLRVDPRIRTKFEDATMEFEDFPLCKECKGTGFKMAFLIELSPGTVTLQSVESSVGMPSPDSSTSQDVQPSILSEAPSSESSGSPSPAEHSVSSPSLTT